MTEPLRPARGGFLRPFGCAQFVREFLLGRGPYGSPKIDPAVGAPQSEICHQYKTALIKARALDMATRREEKTAKREQRPIDPENIETLAEKYLLRIPFKSTSCRFHSFVVYFSTLQRLGWVEPSGKEEPSTFQQHYPQGAPRRYFRLTKKGRQASALAWANPQLALYGTTH